VRAVRPFDDPTSWLLAANRSGQCGFPLASDMRFDSAGARFLLGLLVVVSLVQAEVLRTPRCTGTLEHDGIERLATHVFVVNIGAGESHSQRDALAIGQDMPPSLLRQSQFSNDQEYTALPWIAASASLTTLAGTKRLYGQFGNIPLSAPGCPLVRMIGCLSASVFGPWL
jgi:hypothetical protein